ncbi:MAG: 2-oxo acid dehydrogenase subunit E2 [Anaerolineae bacterium]|nr:2-oxo acid dehydrogenase subunit E2 [Anaerolineae bacterium]
MAVEIRLPKLTHDMEAGVFVEWYRQEGEATKRGEVLYAVETDKATADVEAEADGVLSGVIAQPGDEVAVGQVIAYLTTPGEAAPPPPSAKEAAAPGESAPPPPVQAEAAAPHDAADPGAGGRVVATPLARRVAREKGVELRGMRGSGPRGRIVRADVLAAAERAPAPPAAEALYEIVTRTRVQDQTARRLTQMWQETPQFVLDLAADMTKAMRWRAKTGGRFSFTTLLVRVAAAALRRHPQCNSLLVGGELRRYRAINIGVAMASEAGLVVPVIHDADRLAAEGIQARLDALRARAEAGRLTPDDLRDGTFTVTNLGMYGVDAFTAVLNPPQVAILACGRIQETPVAVAGEVAIRPMLTMRLTVDHRAVDGAEAAPFLAAVKDLLENPYQLI